MPGFDMNSMIWGILMSATWKAAVHLGRDCLDNLRTTMNTDFEKFETLFDISRKLILNQKYKVFGISSSERNTIPWMTTTLLHDRAAGTDGAPVVFEWEIFPGLNTTVAS